MRAIRVLELRSVRGTGGGPEKTILQGAARADAACFDVTVCYLRDRRDRVFAIGSEAKRLGVHYVEIEEAHSLDWRVFRQLRRLVRSTRPDIVHAHEYKSDLLALMLARAEQVVPLATVHGWTGHTRRERWAYYPADKRLLARFPHLIAVSGQIRDELLRHGAAPSSVSVVLNGIDHRVFRRDAAAGAEARRELGFDDRCCVIGAVGRAEPQKRFDVLLETVASLLPEHPHLRLVIAGDGTLLEGLRRLAAELDIAGACLLLGHRTDVVRLQSAFDLFVQSSDYEGTPNCVLEAMACETPVVATDVGGTRDVARPDIDALIVPPRDPGRLREAVHACLANAGATRARVASARARVETELSFDTRMDRVEQIYARLVSRSQTVPDGAVRPNQVHP